ncbi:hypothetical protein BDV93DRAFT_610256 [Ceratobasidium sp. AG-I]|nr:hypothetical protein BDV93DRAFT_610256 [Ceratobasidium sp. AG-I]
MFSKLFNKKNDDDDYIPEISPRPRFRRTKSAASESIYADYLSDDWGDAPTILHDRYGQEILPRAPSSDLEDWQRQDQGGLFTRVRSLSRPNWSRAPPSGSFSRPLGGLNRAPSYGWAERVERAGGYDERQERRDEERARRPVGMPVPNPAPAPIDVRGDEDEAIYAQAPRTAPGTTGAAAGGHMGTMSALQPPALVRRSTRGSNRPGELGGRLALGHRSTTSSPTIIDHKNLPSQRTATPKPVNPITGRPHLSRVEKIAAVLQHVTSLPWLSDSPVNTYYPQDSKIVPVKEPFHTYDIPPSVPKRYRPPPPMPPCWYQPKPPKVKNPKKKKSKEPIKIQIAEEIPHVGYISDDMADEFEYPDYYDYRGYAYTGDTPTLQSDRNTEESETLYDHYNPRLIENSPYSSGMDYPIRPAYFPGPIKSTGLSTARRPEEYGQGVLRIMPPPGAYKAESYDESSESSSSRGPIPSPLSTSNGRVLSRSGFRGPARTPLAIPTQIPRMDPYSAITPTGPPLVIPTPTGTRTPAWGSKGMPTPKVAPMPTPKGMTMPTPKLGPLPGGYSPQQPYSKHYEAAPASGKGDGTSPRRYGLSPGVYGAPPGKHITPPGEYGPSPGKYGPSPRKHKHFAGEHGDSSGDFGPFAGEYGLPPATYEDYGPPPRDDYDTDPHDDYGISPQGYAPYGYGPSPNQGYGPSPKPGYGPPPGVYGPSPQTPYDPSPQAPYGAPPAGYAPYPHQYYSEAAQPVWGWGAQAYGMMPPTQAFYMQPPPPPPIPPTRGDSPPPIPSPIATSVARSQRSRR